MTTVTDTDDIKAEVERFAKQNPDKGVILFHYSGHGEHNATIEVNKEKVSLMDKFTDKITGKGKTDKMQTTDTPVGDCLVGTSGKLFPVSDLKHILLKSNPEKVIISLDMCRNRTRKKRKKKEKKKNTVVLRFACSFLSSTP